MSGSWCTRCDAPYDEGATTCTECGLVFDEPSVVLAGPPPGTGELAFDRAQAVLAACLLAVGLTIAQGLLRVATFDGAPINFRIAVGASAVSPQMGVLLVIAAIGGAAQERTRRFVQVAGGLLIAITLVDAGNWLTLEQQGTGPRVGTAILQLSMGVLAAAAVWLTTRPSLTQAVPDPTGEAPD
ncbi:MAG: hypothetical protein JWO68_2261 [Actinomycetia bacterium]|nr:hypothetical protein [Actinomycetes bacterium]